MKYKSIFVVLLSVSLGIQANAQTKPAPKVTPIAKYKVPKMSTLLGQYKDSVGLPAADAAAVIGSPLRVVDEKKVVYTITSYQFLYKKVGVTETEDGKVLPATSISSAAFTQTPLPAIWISNVKELVKKGEELFFFDIIAKDPQGRPMYAPNLKITIL